MSVDPTSWDSDPKVREWLERAETEMGPKMRQSTLAVHIVPDDAGDAKFWVEVGAAICMDKPIVLAVAPGRQIPMKLAMVADAIVDYDGSPEAVEDLAETIRMVVRDAV
jgi:hypothetical protein